MSLPEPNPAVEEERVVVVSGLSRDRLARRIGELVAGADHESRRTRIARNECAEANRPTFAGRRLSREKLTLRSASPATMTLTRQAFPAARIASSMRAGMMQSPSSSRRRSSVRSAGAHHPRMPANRKRSTPA